MSETKLEVKTVGYSEKFSLASENSLPSENQRFRKTCEKFAMPNSEIFLFFLIFFFK